MIIDIDKRHNKEMSRTETQTIFLHEAENEVLPILARSIFSQKTEIFAVSKG